MRYYISRTEEMGRGINALYNLSPGDYIMGCQLLILSKDDTIAVRKTQLGLYLFAYNEFQDCIALAHGSLFNHSDKPNVGYKLTHHPGEDPMLEFYALCDIAGHEQLFIDYNADVPVDIKTYTQNLDGR